jgi:protein-tyrosine phosphatase
MSSALRADRLADALHKGTLVALPSQTGWMAMARAGERERLVKLSGINLSELGVTAGTVQDLREFLPPHGLRGQRLIERLLPGPVALRLNPTSPRLRLPSHHLWKTLSDCRDPLLAVPLQQDGSELWTSGEVIGRWPSLTCVDDPTGANERIDETRLTIDRGAVTIESAGDLSAQDLQDAARIRLLCVCSGNTCRSPMLMTLLRAALARNKIEGVTVESAGAFANRGDAASEHAITTMKARGIDLLPHRSRPIDRLDLSWYDRLICLTFSHAAFLRQMGCREEQLVVINAERGGVPDPFGGAPEAYEACASVLEQAVTKIIDDI